MTLSAAEIAAYGSLATVVLGAVVAGVVALRKQYAAESEQDDNRADATWREVVTTLKESVESLQTQHREVSVKLLDCKEEHARSDERIKHVEAASRKCEEDRQQLSRRLDTLEDSIRLN